MSAPAVKLYRDLQKSRFGIVTDCYPAFDELLAYALERKYLKLPEFKDVLVATAQSDSDDEALNSFLKKNVRLMKIDEISFDAAEHCHLPTVESIITSMRDRGYSLVFAVQGERFQTSVYLGISRFAGDAGDITSVIDGYQATWEANFPGSQFKQQSDKDVKGLSYKISQCKSIGVLTGIPSLKRDEESSQFVQGLERLIRAMRGKNYFWITVADPLPEDVVGNAINACQHLQSDIHHLVKTDLSKSTSNGKTIMLGGFGMIGHGTTDGNAHTDSTSTATSTSDTHTQNKLEGYQRVSAAATPVLGIAGSIVGSFICPGVGTVLGGMLGPVIGNLINGIGGAVTGKNGFSDSHTDTLSKTITSADTISKAVSQQAGLGGFGSLGLTLTKTTTVGEELLNRKAEYVEECLKKYEARLHEGTAIGMWNLGHYFCAEDKDTFNLGAGVVSSLFTGMDSAFEPPRTITMPESFSGVLRRFNNVYLQFCDRPVDRRSMNTDSLKLENHPLGVIFNGPATPVTTRELAVAMPVATRDVEGVTVSERASFGVDIPTFRFAQKSITVGTIMDRGNATCLDYQLALENLPKHLAVFGLTGSGKTNTVHHLLTQLWKNDNHVPFMVIEPAKAEYRALAKTDELKDRLLVFTAGVDKTSVSPLRLNPFDFNPGKDDDAHRVHILTHIDRLKSVFNASFPMYASMPYILEEAILEVYKERGWDLAGSRNVYVKDIYTEDFSDYVPTLEDLYYKIDAVVTRKGYFKEQQMNIQAALKSRLSSLMVGAKGSLFNCRKSISDADLFERPVVVELENMGDDDEKAFLMGMLVTRLYEYRKATFSNRLGDSNKTLRHVLVIEEAHRLLANIPDTSANAETANIKGKSVSAFIDMLAEIRAFGQSVFIVDQLPSRVSPNIVKGTGAKIVHRLLARDDRESVGETMGLSEDQIKDLCLLRTGECVVNQDGDRKAYLCVVRENSVHAQREGGEVSSATRQFVDEHQDILANELSAMDLDNDILRSCLYRIMLAAGISSGCVNTHRLENFKEHTEEPNAFAHRLCAYWTQISRSIWGYYQGDYAKYLSLVSEGKRFLMAQASELTDYRKAFADYFSSSRISRKYLTDNLPLIAYDHLFLITKALARINEQFDKVTGANSAGRLGRAIRTILPELLPSDDGLANRVVKAVAEAIVDKVNANVDLSDVVAVVKKGDL